MLFVLAAGLVTAIIAIIALALLLTKANASVAHLRRELADDTDYTSAALRDSQAGKEQYARALFEIGQTMGRRDGESCVSAAVRVAAERDALLAKKKKEPMRRRAAA